MAGAGFFLGVILYLTFWFPKRYRGRVTAGFMTAIPIASFIAALLSGFLLKPQGFGLRNWQRNVHPGEIPAVLLGFVVLRILMDRPSQSAWLTEEQQTRLTNETDAERDAALRSTGGHDHGSARFCAPC